MTILTKKLMLGCGAATIALALATGAWAEQRAFDVASQPAPQAIAEFARQAGVQIVAPVSGLQAVRTPAVRGRLDVRAALTVLLRGTGLEVVHDSGSLITLGRAVEAEAAAQGAEDEAAVLEEVIVTASKRAENVQDVPSSISVLGGDRLERLNATQLTVYAAYVPGLQVDSNGTPGQTTITLRGINPIGASSAVGVYIDDAPLGSSSSLARAATFGLDLLPYDVQRVEVLRGPQGTLYGASTMGGLLKYVTRPADTSGFQGRVGVDVYGIDGAGDLGWGARAMINAPFSDTLAVRLSAAHQEAPGYIDGVSGDEDRNEVVQSGARLALLWRPVEDLTIKLSAMTQDVDADSRAVVTLTPQLRPAFGDLTDAAIPTPFSQTLRYYTATANWDLGWAELISATSYSTLELQQRQDGTNVYGFAVPFLTAGAITSGFVLPVEFGLEFEKVTQEVRLVSPSGGTVEWIVGAFYTHENVGNFQSLSAFDATTGALLDPPTIVGGMPLSPLVDGRLPSTYEEVAAFGDLTYRFSERFDLTGGLRVARNHQKFTQIGSGPMAVLGGAAGVSGGRSSESVVTYMVSPRFHVTPDVMVYARVASGYRPGGPNVALTGVPPTIDADTLVNYEVGFKSELFDRRLLINVAAYQIDWKDIQLTVSGALGSYGDNGGTARSRGIEFESVLQPVAGLRLGFNAAYTDAELTEDSPPGAPGIDGDRLPGTPRWSTALTADYEFPVGGDWTGEIGGGFRFVGDRAPDLPSTIPPGMEAKSYTVLDLHAALSSDRWTLRLFARNLGNEDAYLTVATLPSLEGAILQPRTIGLSLDAKF